MVIVGGPEAGMARAEGGPGGASDAMAWRIYVETFRNLPFGTGAAFNLLDSWLGLILVYVAFNLPFAIWFLRSFLAEVPVELEEAALLDGLSRLQIIRRVVVPVAMPGLASTAIFTFVFMKNEYLMALLLTSIRAVTVPVTITKFVLPYSILWGDLSAAVVIQLVPMLAVVFLLQRHIVRGMTLGAVK